MPSSSTTRCSSCGRPGSTLATSGPNSRLVDQRDEVGVVEQVAQLVGDVPVVDVDRHRAGLEAAEHRLDPLGAVHRVDADMLAGPHADVVRGSCANRFARSSSSREREPPVAGDERERGRGPRSATSSNRSARLNSMPRTITGSPIDGRRRRSADGRVACERPTRRYPAGRGRDTALPRDQRRASRRSPSGGNAIDAALAANLVLGVVAPYLCGYGGDVLAMVWDGSLHGYIGAGRAPRAATIRGGPRTQRRAAQPARRHADVRSARGDGARARRAAGSICSSGGGAVRSASSRRRRCATPRTGSR